MLLTCDRKRRTHPATSTLNLQRCRLEFAAPHFQTSKAKPNCQTHQSNIGPDRKSWMNVTLANCSKHWAAKVEGVRKSYMQKNNIKAGLFWGGGGGGIQRAEEWWHQVTAGDFPEHDKETDSFFLCQSSLLLHSHPGF